MKHHLSVGVHLSGGDNICAAGDVGYTTFFKHLNLWIVFFNIE
jgi:hypothetical protein